MPLYDYKCDACQKVEEILAYNNIPPTCCERPMRRIFSIDKQVVKIKYPSWVDRIDDIHKAQEQRGERLRFVHPKEVRAT